MPEIEIITVEEYSPPLGRVIEPEAYVEIPVVEAAYVERPVMEAAYVEMPELEAPIVAIEVIMPSPTVQMSIVSVFTVTRF